MIKKLERPNGSPFCFIIISKWWVKFLAKFTGNSDFAEGVTLWPFIFIMPDALMKRTLERRQTLLQHELIHIKQQAELLLIFMLIIYFIELFYGTIVRKENIMTSYYKISFEKEAYKHQKTPNYFKKRKSCASFRS